MGTLKQGLVVVVSLAVLVYGTPVGFAAPAAGLGLTAPVSASQIGIVAAVRGTVQLERAGQVGAFAESGAPVFLGDEVKTDEDGQLQIMLLDETIFTIGPSSVIVIDKFIYDPASQDGKVEARVVKGVFRFVTGKIARKKPDNMKVKLPSGTIGIRGTIAGGIVKGLRSEVVLLGPGGLNNADLPPGGIYLENPVNGRMFKEEVVRSEYGSVIEGKNTAPKKAFKFPKEKISQITEALTPKPKVQEPDADAGGKGGSKNLNEKSGQEGAQAGKKARKTQAVRKAFKKLARNSRDSSQDSGAQLIKKVPDGPTTRNQLQIAAQQIQGSQTFSQDGAAMSGMETGSYSLSLKVDFGNRKIGGSGSNVTGSLNSSGTFQFDLAERSFGVGSANAVFQYQDVNNSSSGGSPCSGCKGDITIDLKNSGGEIAKVADHNVKVKSGSFTLASGAGSATRS